MLIPRSVLVNAPVCADPTSSRYALGGVLIERPCPNGKPIPDPMSVSTDGRRMLVLSWQEDNAEDYPAGVPADFNRDPIPGSKMLVPLAACKRLSKLAEVKRSPKPILYNVIVEERPLDNKEPTIRAFATDLENGSNVTEREMEGRFPKWRDVFPTYTPANSVSIDVDPKLLEGVCKALKNHCDAVEETSVRLTFGIQHVTDDEGNETSHAADSHAILVSAKGHSRNGIAVVMPCANEVDDKKNPVWEGPYWMPPAEISPAIAALPDEFTANTDDSLKFLMEFSIFPPMGWTVKRNADHSWTAEAPADEADEDGCEIYTFDNHCQFVAKFPRPTKAVVEDIFTWQPAVHLKIAADSIEELRSCDVHRVLDTAGKEHRHEMAVYIKDNRKELAEEVDAVMDDLCTIHTGEVADDDADKPKLDALPEHPADPLEPGDCPKCKGKCRIAAPEDSEEADYRGTIPCPHCEGSGVDPDYVEPPEPIYDDAGHFIPENFMAATVGDDGEWFSCLGVIESCPVKDREALAVYLFQEYPDLTGEIHQAMHDAVPVGPECVEVV